MTIDLNQLFIRSFSPDQDIPRLLVTFTTPLKQLIILGMRSANKLSEINWVHLGMTPSKDRWVVESPDEPSKLVGSALVKTVPGTPLSEGNISVHPGWRHQGIGSALLSRVVDRARQLDSTSMQIYANAGHPDAPGFLQKRGFTAQGAYTELRLSEGIRLPPVIWPFGYTMRPYAEVEDVSTPHRGDKSVLYPPLGASAGQSSKR